MTSALSRSARRIISSNLTRTVRLQSIWTPDNVVKSPYKDVDIPNRTIIEHVWENLARWPDKTATICGLTNRSYTYHQLFKYSRNLASQLRSKLGITDGDVICTMMNNSPEYVLAVLGILSSGAELTTVNPIYTAHEVYRQLLLSRPKVMIGSTDTVNVIKESLKMANMDIPVICVTTSGGLPAHTISFQELTGDADHDVLKDVKITADDVAILPYSSGTTGLPKGVELTNKNVVVNCVQSDVDGVKQYRDTTTYVDQIVCGAAPLPKLDIDRLLDKSKIDVNFIQLYGLTETSPLVTTMVPGTKNYLTAGVAIPNTELRIVDSEMKTLGPNEVGELHIRGPQVMKGYRNNFEATRNAIDENGWFKSGDLASLDQNGTITISDRLKELIKVKGFQVPPAELESVLKEHPSVLDAGVVGVPDTRTGEAPIAFIVLNDGHKADVHGIKEFVATRVAEFKRLKDVVFLENLPKNPSGKLLRRILKEKYA
ncbi:hypothetical protein MSG28_004798 [Choristoneura fumiferana]|uniref:Uncharacterized protein n=1 Tax=Choristoneura fumiferana TaxID=7141 RepID=A0ACC0K7B8_CHOFU|nr:hypothetical protein MSG28_004798 [Choristoneura fumiferana]